MTANSGRWVAVGVPDTVTHGGSLRAQYLFRSLIERTDALAFYRPDPSVMFHRVLRRPLHLLPGVNVAAAELLPLVTIPVARRLTRLRVLDLHDLPVLHAEALGARLTGREARAQQRLTDANVDAFERIVVVSCSMIETGGLPAPRCIVIGNGTDTSLIRPGLWPDRPTIGLVSAAAPGRGIEHLIEAARSVRRYEPDTALRLCLAPTDADGLDYLRELHRNIEKDDWISIESVPYERLSEFLASTTVLVVPHPPGPSWDLAPTVKLFDYMAAGRPVVVTPRIEMARVVTDENVGIVAAGDHLEDLSEAIRIVVQNERRARNLGANARRAAEMRYDWRILSEQLADEFVR